MLIRSQSVETIDFLTEYLMELNTDVFSSGEYTNIQNRQWKVTHWQRGGKQLSLLVSLRLELKMCATIASKWPRFKNPWCKFSSFLRTRKWKRIFSQFQHQTRPFAPLWLTRRPAASCPSTLPVTREVSGVMSRLREAQCVSAAQQQHGKRNLSVYLHVLWHLCWQVCGHARKLQISHVHR